MSDLSKLLVKLAKEGIVVELRPYDYIDAIRIRLYTSDLSNIITGIVTFGLIEHIKDIDVIEHKINELYEELKKDLEGAEV